jgi:ABC-type multidrug transport system fused ATPase/permease subunit
LKVQKLLGFEDLPQEQSYLGEQAEVEDTWPEKGTVEFKNVKMRYRPTTEQVIKGLSFLVKGGDKVGIVGRTGAGKSTVSIALSRLLETESGVILIDGIDISRVPLLTLRERVTMIPQDPTLLKGTLRSNLDP